MVGHSHRFSPAEYLQWETRQQMRHEYVNGEIVAMTGGSVAHNAVTFNVARAIADHLERSDDPCRVFISDIKVQISESGPFYYPDVLVACDERDRDASYTIRYPRLIVEVLSPSTEAFDRGNKFADYRRIPTLREYVLFDSQKIAVEHHCRVAEKIWQLREYAPDEPILTLQSLGCTLSIPGCYRNVVFVPVGEEPGSS
jgi:Uma2 family endonuclease